MTREDRLVLLSLAVTLAGVAVAALFRAPASFGVTALLVIAILLIGWGWLRTPRLGWLLLFGLAAGVLEPWTDWLHVVHLQSLVYSEPFGFRILASPSYLPVGWWFTTVQFGYLALRLSDVWPRWRAVAAVTAAGMAIPPFYEEAAAVAGAWHYTTDGPMLSNTPLWVVLAYGGCAFFMAAPAVELYEPGARRRAVLGGVFAAAGLMLSSVVFLWALG